MKARVKATGEIVEVEFTERKTHTDEEVYITQEGCLIEESRLDFNVETIDYWTRLEHQYAGMAMQAYIIASHISQFSFCEGDMGDCKNMAHALVEKMKEAD